MHFSSQKVSDHSTNSKSYERDRKRLYRENHRTFQVTVPREKARQIENAASTLGYTPRELILALLRAHEAHGHLVLPPTESVRALFLELKRIGTNINQTVRYVNTHRELKTQDFKRLQNLLVQVERAVVSRLTKAKPITVLVSDHLQQYPEDAEKIREVINSHSR